MKEQKNVTYGCKSGWCLHNISETLLNCWITFSQRCEQYSSTAEEDCKREWDKMEKKDMSIGSLHMWAKKDNEKAYIEITRNDLEYYISTTVCRVGNKNMGPKRQTSYCCSTY